MAPFVIVRSTDPVGRGTRGGNLYRFLRICFGRGAVDIISPSDLENGSRRRAEVLFIGMPTTLDETHLSRVNFRKAVLFDYGDRAGPDWRESNQGLLQSISGLYLKSWVEADWGFGLKWGALPIRRYRGLTWHVRAFRRLRAGYPDVVPRDHDVSFLGRATSYFGTVGVNRYSQRVEWLQELHASRSGFAFWGGLQVPRHDHARLRNEFGAIDHLFFGGGRLPYPMFYYHLLRSKMVLAPVGNARWSYRHYEAIYAGALVVSNDLCRVRTFIPLPLDSMVNVDDHAPLIPALEEGAALLDRDPQLPRRNLEFLEQYLTDGDYDRNKPYLSTQFLAEIGES